MAKRKSMDTGEAGNASHVTVAIVLDRPASREDEPKLAHLVRNVIAAEIAHLTLIGAGPVGPEGWGVGLEPSLEHEITPGLRVRRFGGPIGLTILPAGAGRLLVFAAARLKAARGGKATSIAELDDIAAEVAGPAPDLIVVTGGKSSLCGALTWSAAYGELVFFDRPWAQLTHDDIDHALKEFAGRGRRFGGIAGQAMG